jgi:hypothetical protein
LLTPNGRDTLIGTVPIMATNYFCLLEYKAGEAAPPCAASDEGVFETKSLVYPKMVVAKSMPPAAEPQPSQADLDQVGNWILGGGPPRAMQSGTSVGRQGCASVDRYQP